MNPNSSIRRVPVARAIPVFDIGSQIVRPMRSPRRSPSPERHITSSEEVQPIFPTLPQMTVPENNQTETEEPRLQIEGQRFEIEEQKLEPPPKQRIFLITKDNCVFKCIRNSLEENIKLETYDGSFETTGDVIWEGDCYYKYKYDSFRLMISNHISINQKLDILREKYSSDMSPEEEISMINKILDDCNIKSDTNNFFEKRNRFNNKQKETDNNAYSRSGNNIQLMYQPKYVRTLTPENSKYIFSKMVYPFNMYLGENYYTCLDWIKNFNFEHLMTLKQETLGNLLERTYYNLFKLECCLHKSNYDKIFLDYDICVKLIELSRPFLKDRSLIPILCENYKLIQAPEIILEKNFLSHSLLEKELRESSFSKILNLINWNKCTLTGSYLLSLLKYRLTNKTFIPNDIDIIVNIDPVIMNDRKKYNIEEELGKFCEDLRYKCKEVKIKMTRIDRNAGRNKFEFTFDDNSKVQIDFIAKIICPELVIRDFHLSCVKALYSPEKGIRITPSCLISIVSGIVLDINAVCPITAIQKYNERGFSFLINDYESEKCKLPCIGPFKGKKLVDSKFHNHH